MSHSNRDDWSPPRLPRAFSTRNRQVKRTGTGEVVPLNYGDRNVADARPDHFGAASPPPFRTDALKTSNLSAIPDARRLGEARLDADGSVLTRHGERPRDLEAAVVVAAMSDLNQALQILGLGEVRAQAVSTGGTTTCGSSRREGLDVVVFKAANDHELLFSRLLRESS